MSNHHDPHHKDIDEVTGVETTGHEWDGIKELNNPLPRWWLWVLYATIIFSVGYWFVYPTWPTFSDKNERGGTVGSFEWNSIKHLKEQQAEITAHKAVYSEKFDNSSYDEILKDKALTEFALAGGEIAFKDNCATCHSAGGAGRINFPNLTDDDWLWGGKLADIEQTLRYGIRSGHENARDSLMPEFGMMLQPKEINQVASFVYKKSHAEAEENSEDIAKGQEIFTAQCSSCHGENAEGNRDFGAPNISDAIWLHSIGEKEDIIAQLKNPQHGVMPYWEGRLSDETIRQLAIYVHSLGGGE